jgi:hypothetical protein
MCFHTAGQWVLRTPDQDPVRNLGNKKKPTPQVDRLISDSPVEGSGGLAGLISEEWGQDQNVDRSECDDELSASRTEINFSMEYASPVRDVLKAARSETSDNDEMYLHKRSVSQMDGKISPILNRLRVRPQTNLGRYTDMKTMSGRTEVMPHGVLKEKQIDPRLHVFEEELSMHDHVSGVGKGAIFFKPHELVDPVQAFRDRERRFKRDGSLRDRLGRGENEAVIRMKLRSHKASVIEGPMKELPRKDDLRVKAEDVPREVRRALALLGRGPSPMPLVAGGATTPIDSALVFDRMHKGQTSWDVNLIAARKTCVLPEVQIDVHNSTSKADTSAMPTKQMIQAHATMLDEKAHEATNAGCEVFQVSEFKRLDRLRKISWDVVKRWEERLSALPRIRKALMELYSHISEGGKKEPASHSAIFGAILRTGLDERAQRVLAMPDIRTIFVNHKDALVSEGRRMKIRQTLDALFGKKLVIAQLRSGLQHYFKEFKIEWEDAVPMLEALRTEDLEVCLKSKSEAEADQNYATSFWSASASQQNDGHGEEKEDVEEFNFLLSIMERKDEKTNLAGAKFKVAKLKKTAGELLQTSAKQRREVFGFIESKLNEKFGPLENYVPPEERDTTPTCMLDKLWECSKRASEKIASIRDQLDSVQAEVASLTEIINAADGKATTEQTAHLHHLSELQVKNNMSLERCREVEDLDSITSEIIRYRKHVIDIGLSIAVWAVDNIVFMATRGPVLDR